MITTIEGKGQAVPPRNQRFWLTTDEVSTVIDAPAEQLYDMVADMPRMGEWSRECATVEWTEGATGPTVVSALPSLVVLSMAFGALYWIERR